MTQDRFPNLYIIGAPKSGTTAMSHYLAKHPDIFMSETAGEKEPAYFASDLWDEKTKIKTRDTYLGLFKDAPPDACYLGEASTAYLYSQAAIPNILSVEPSARLIAMIRNPIEVAQGLHNHFVKKSNEPIINFEQAWKAQEDRRQGTHLPSWQSDYRYFMYGKRSCLGNQLHRVFQTVPKSQVHVVIYDDFAKNPKQAYLDTLQFLGLEPSGDETFPVANPSLRFRYPGIQRWLIKARSIRERLGLPGGLGIHKTINKFNTKVGTSELRPAFRRELQEYFCSEIDLLSKLLNRDFSHWLD